MDPASAAPVAGSAGIPAAPRTPASSLPSAGRSRTAAPPPAGSSPPLPPRAAPARTVPRLSSLRPLPILAEDLLMPDFCSGAAGLPGRFTEGFSLRRSQRAITAWYRSEIPDEYAPDGILIDLDTECTRYLLGNLPAAEAGVSPLHLDDRVNHFFRGTFGSRAMTLSRVVEKIILALHQGVVKSQKGGRL